MNESQIVNNLSFTKLKFAIGPLQVHWFIAKFMNEDACLYSQFLKLSFGAKNMKALLISMGKKSALKIGGTWSMHGKR